MQIDKESCWRDEHQLLSLTSPERRRRIVSFRFDIDKKLSLYADIIVRYLCCRKLHIKNQDICFAADRYNKPYIIGYPSFHFNISHTKSAIAISVSNRAVGVDIERVGTCDLHIVKRFFTDNERNYILNSRDRDKAFYEVWTRKEAYVKWKGIGLTVPLKSFDVFEHQSLLRTFYIDQYILSVCSENIDKMSKPKMIQKTNISDMAEFILRC